MMVWAVEFRLASLAFTPPPTPSDTNSRVVSVLRSLSLKRSSNAVAYPLIRRLVFDTQIHFGREKSRKFTKP
jgi:hypothetical protein